MGEMPYDSLPITHLVFVMGRVGVGLKPSINPPESKRPQKFFAHTFKVFRYFQAVINRYQDLALADLVSLVQAVAMIHPTILFLRSILLHYYSALVLPLLGSWL